VVEGALIVMLLVQRRQRTRAQEALARSFDLARLVSEISATLAAVSPAEAQRAIRPALLRVAHALHFDRASVIELTEDPRVAVTDSVAVPGGEPLPGTLDVDRFPWTVEALKRGDVVQWSSGDRIPAAAEQDRLGFAALGTASFVAVPLIVGQTAVGAFSLSSATPMPRWPEPLIEQLRLLGEVFAHVMVRRRAEATIRESEERFRLMSDSAPVMIWMADLDGACTYCNRPWLEFTGRRLEDELRDGWTHGIHADDRPFILARYRAHLAARTEFLLEYRLRRHDGTYRSVVDRGIPRFAIDGTFSGYVGACSDITEIKQAHATMLETLALRGAIFGSLYGHVAAVDRAGVIVAVNESWSRFQAEHGRDTLRPPIGANYRAACRDAAAGGDASAHQVEAMLGVVLEGRATRSSCEYVTRSDREERWFEMTVEPFTRPEGGAIVTHIDITRRRRAEAEARREHEQLTHALRVRTVGELTASLAHEISQPLAAILSNAQAARLILEKEERFDDDVHGAVTDIASDAKRAAHVIHQLRALFRNEWSEQRMRIDVNGVVADATSLLRTELETKGVRLQLALGTPLPAVFGDAVQLQQVLLNVIANAVEAMVSGATTDPVVSVTTRRTGQGTVELTISDHGPGVPDDQRDRIFEPFITTKHTGLGMGLSISRSIVQAHGGRIWVTANGACGLRVHIELPCEEQEDTL
jgi:PAS domain S-box-containing protein